MADNDDVFRMLAAEDKLDGTNYSLWEYMMRHVLLAKGLWNIVAGIEFQPPSRQDRDAFVEDGTDGSCRDVAPPVAETPATQELKRWNSRVAQTHALIALSVKWTIIPHIRSCKATKEAWDVLCTLCQARNEARVAYLQ